MMTKKTLGAVALLALALAGCQTDTAVKTFTLTGNDLHVDASDSYVYFLSPEDLKNPMDSVQIVDGAFSKVFDPADTTAYYAALIGNKTVFFITEPGTAEVVYNEASRGYNIIPSDSLGLNARMHAYRDESNATLTPFEAKFQEVYTQYAKEEKDGSLTEEKGVAYQAQLDSINKLYDAANDEIVTRYYESNKNNALGAIVFGEKSFVNDSAFIVAYEGASDVVKNTPNLKKRYETIKKAEATQAGKSYVDFTIDNGEGQTAKLSDYLTDDRYLLVDFWASWCGPCRAAMPHLADLNKNHSKTLRVLSIGVWEESMQDNEDAKKELEMTWETLFDSKNEGPATYGVQGIPTLLLIAPDGTIVLRTHSPKEIDEKMAELKI